MKHFQQNKRNKVIRGFVKLGFGPREVLDLLRQFHPELIMSTNGKELTEQRIGQIMAKMQKEIYGEYL